MTAPDVDTYLAGLEQPQRETLLELRRRILEVVPDAEECISYGMPAFKVGGKTVAGFAAFKNHLGYFPHSGSVLPKLKDELSAYEMTQGSLHFSTDDPLPHDLVRTLVETRLQDAGLAPPQDG